MVGAYYFPSPQRERGQDRLAPQAPYLARLAVYDNIQWPEQPNLH
jgi:hypothetical protein